MFIKQVLVHLSGIYPDHPTLYPIPLKSHPALHSIPVKAQIKKIQMCGKVGGKSYSWDFHLAPSASPPSCHLPL